MKKARISDVAALAGVAPSTASAALTDAAGARIRESTRKRVREAARELGYTPNTVARSLRTQRSNTIAFISDVIATTPYAGQLIQGAQDAAWDAGYLLMLVNTGGDRSLERHAINALKQQQIDGVLYSTMYHRAVDIPEELTGLPVVLLDARPASGDHAYVVPDEYGGACAAVAEIIRHGHERIAFILDERDGPAASGRLAGFEDTLKRHGLAADPALIVRTQSDSRGGEAAAHRLLDADAPPTAIFAFNDQMAIGVYRAVAERDLRIPRDLSVMGFDDLYVISSELTPGLTTMALPHYEMGREAARQLIAAVAAPGTASAGEIRVPCPLVRRASIDRPRAVGERP